MQQNCAATCHKVATEGVGTAGNAHKADAFTCARWAMSGYCADNHAHAAFMRQNCAEACEQANNIDPAASAPPPFDIWVVLIIGGFGAAIFYAVQGAVKKDGELSHSVRKKTLAEAQAIGPGKMNKSAMGAKDGRGMTAKRSAKKA